MLISVLAYFPFVYLPVAAQLRRIDPALEDTAGSLGLGPGDTVLLLLGLGISVISFGTGRRTVLTGLVHLVVFCAYVFLIFLP